jgi:asparagine synthase (glutamine-hydrolysing)
MAHALEPAHRFVTAAHHEQGIGLGRIGLEFVGSGREVAWNADRTRCLVFEGELYDTAALTRALGVERAGVDSDAALLLRLYEQFGEAFLPRVNGGFVAALWDRPERRLVVFNDRLGLFPLYYARPNGDLLFASGVRALLADPSLERSVDRVALNQFLVFDHMLDDRTLLAGARLLPQAAVLTCRDGDVSLRQYWTPRYPDVYEPRPERTYVDGFVHHLRQAVARQSADDLSRAVLLSGGMDSRLLLGPLAERGETVRTLTFGIPGCDDASVAAEVAAALRTTHHFFELKPDWLAGLGDEAVRVTDGG